MDKGTQGVVAAITVLVTVGVALVSVAVSVGTTDSGNPNGFAVTGGFVLLAAVLLLCIYFGLYPMLVGLAARRDRRLAQARSLRSATVIIHSATYGAPGKRDQWLDVTDVIRALTGTGGAQFILTNDAMGGDPAPQIPKTLWVKYSHGGTDHDKSWTEEQTVVIP
jgi:hypothetical protein